MTTSWAQDFDVEDVCDHAVNLLLDIHESNNMIYSTCVFRDLCGTGFIRLIIRKVCICRLFAKRGSWTVLDKLSSYIPLNNTGYKIFKTPPPGYITKAKKTEIPTEYEITQ